MEAGLVIVIVVAISISGCVGFYLAWIARERELQVKLQAKDTEIQNEKMLRHEREEAIGQLEDRFEVIASKVMREHSRDFLGEFEKARKVHTSDVEHKERDFEKIAKDINTSMHEVQGKIESFEKERKQERGELTQSIKHVLDTGARMQEAAVSLKAVLSNASAVRGRWGETVLKNLLEESGLTEGIDFRVQDTIEGDENANLRPDVIINLPGDLQLAIDSKASLEEFFKAVEEKDEEKKREHIVQFAQHLKGHIRALSSKEYQRHLDNRIPYVILFVPGEAAIRAVFEYDVDMYREAQARRVMLASPATIMPLILLIAHAWKQHARVENAEKLGNEIIELGARLKAFIGHIAGIGISLSQATDRFNKAAGSWDTRVYPKIEQINTLGGNMQLEDGSIKQVEIEPRLPVKTVTANTPLLEKKK